MEIENINEAWDDFITNEVDDGDDCSPGKSTYVEDIVETKVSETLKRKVPKCGELHISTKTKIAHLNQAIDLNEIFWKLSVDEFHIPKCGIIKKQMKISSSNKKELEGLLDKIKREKRLVNQNILSHIDKPDGRIKFKDVRKINIGISKKDIESYRSKIKSAFYNCFVLIIRIIYNNEFKELHVKVFNTGQLEIPGIKTDDMFEDVMEVVLEKIQPFVTSILDYDRDKTETILYNSNFNCGFYINRDKFYNLLKYKYKIQAIYDPCSYPGIQCKFYYNDEEGNHGSCTGIKMNDSDKKISFMIFRTGSTLIVGKCAKQTLESVYKFLKQIMSDQYDAIYQEPPEEIKKKDKKRKIKRKIYVKND